MTVFHLHTTGPLFDTTTKHAKATVEMALNY